MVNQCSVQQGKVGQIVDFVDSKTQDRAQNWIKFKISKLLQIGQERGTCVVDHYSIDQMDKYRLQIKAWGLCIVMSVALNWCMSGLRKERESVCVCVLPTSPIESLFKFITTIIKHIAYILFLFVA